METIVRQPGRLHSTRTLCVGRWRGGWGSGVGGQLEKAWGGASDMYVRSGVTSFNSCPNPELETISLLQWHRIRLDLTRSYSHLQQGGSFPCCLPTSQFLIAKTITHPWQRKRSPLPTASNRFFMICQITEPTTAPVPAEFLCWQSWMLLEPQSQ